MANRPFDSGTYCVPFMILVRPAAQEIDSELERRHTGIPEPLKEHALATGRRLCGTEHSRDTAHARPRFRTLEPPALFAIKLKRAVLSA